MIWICLTTDPCPTRSTLRCREGSDEDFLFADYLTRFPFSPCCPTRATLHSGCPPLLGKELHEEPLQKCWGQLTLWSAVVSQLPEQKTVNLAERYRTPLESYESSHSRRVAPHRWTSSAAIHPVRAVPVGPETPAAHSSVSARLPSPSPE